MGAQVQSDSARDSPVEPAKHGARACDRCCGDRQGEEGDHQGDGPRADAADVGQEEEGEEGDEEAEEEGQEEEEKEEEEGQEEEEEKEEEEGHQVPGRQAAEGRPQEQGVEGGR